MEIKPPPPFISAYSIMELTVLNHPQTGKPYLAHKDGRIGKSGERYVNTVDIEVQYLLPGAFIVGWQETHYEGYYDANAALRFRETTITRTHQENKQRVLKLKEWWEAFYKQPTTAAMPEMISLEQELHKLGWEFHYQAEIGPLYNPEIESQINFIIPQESEFSNYHMHDPNYSTLLDPINLDRGVITETKVRRVAGLSQEFLKPQEDSQSRIESKIDSLAESINQLVGVLSQNANGHHVRTPELCPPKPAPVRRKRSRSNTTRSETAPSGTELGVSEDVPTGQLLLE